MPENGYLPKVVPLGLASTRSLTWEVGGGKEQLIAKIFAIVEFNT
jgi:hypothetical protein